LEPLIVDPRLPTRSNVRFCAKMALGRIIDTQNFALGWTDIE